MPKKSLGTWVLIFLCAATASTFAEEENPCVSSFSNNVRDISFASDSSAANNSVYDFFCNQTGISKTDTFEGGMEMFEFLGIDHKGVKTRDLMNEYCSEKREERVTNATSRDLKSTVVTEALSTFNQCLQILRDSKVLITHQATLNSIIVTIDIPEKGLVAVNEVIADGSLSCTSTTPAMGKESQDLDLTDLKAQLIFDQDVKITCRRTGSTDEAGSIVFAPAELSVATNVGDYAVRVTQDALYSGQLASDAAARIEALEGANTALRKETAAAAAAFSGERDQFETQLDALRAAYKQKDSFPVVLFHGESNPFAGLFGSLPVYYEETGCPKNDAMINRGIRNACPAGYEAKMKINRFINVNAGRCGHTFHVIQCTRDPLANSENK